MRRKALAGAFPWLRDVSFAQFRFAVAGVYWSVKHIGCGPQWHREWLTVAHRDLATQPDAGCFVRMLAIYDVRPFWWCGLGVPALVERRRHVLVYQAHRKSLRIDAQYTAMASQRRKAMLKTRNSFRSPNRIYKSPLSEDGQARTASPVKTACNRTGRIMQDLVGMDPPNRRSSCKVPAGIRKQRQPGGKPQTRSCIRKHSMTYTFWRHEPNGNRMVVQLLPLFVLVFQSARCFNEGDLFALLHAHMLHWLCWNTGAPLNAWYKRTPTHGMLNCRSPRRGPRALHPGTGTTHRG